MTEQSMVERVARAIIDADENAIDSLWNPGEYGWAEFIARAAIEAMREPNDNIVSSIRDAFPYFISAESARRIAQAMIDAALKED